MSTRPRNTPPSHLDEFDSWFTEFCNKINYGQARLRFRRRVSVGSPITVSLNGPHREEIHRLINKIRKVVANLQVSESKREAIYKKLARLAEEVDRDKTKIDALMSLILETSATAGQAAENLDPFVKLLERIRDVFAGAQQDNPALPAPESTRQTKQVSGPRASAESDRTSLDDDAPF